MATRKRLQEIPCSIAGSLDVIGEWWTPLVLRDLHYGLRRFEEIATDLPIARNILASRLKTLVREGLVTREQYASGPARYEYELTEKGLETFGVLMALMAWGDRWAGESDTPPVTILCRRCERETTAEVTCAGCHGVLTPTTVGVRPNHGQEVPRRRMLLRRPDR